MFLPLRRKVFNQRKRKEINKLLPRIFFALYFANFSLPCFVGMKMILQDTSITY